MEAESGMGANFIGNMLGGTSPRIDKLAAVAKYFGVSVGALIDEPNDAPRCQCATGTAQDIRTAITTSARKACWMLGISEQEALENAGLSKDMLSRVRVGYIPTAFKCALLASALGIGIDQLIGLPVRGDSESEKKLENARMLAEKAEHILRKKMLDKRTYEELKLLFNKLEAFW
jgi:transcriptional regulator with XRE-family HTH domain